MMTVNGWEREKQCRTTRVRWMDLNTVFRPNHVINDVRDYSLLGKERKVWKGHDEFRSNECWGWEMMMGGGKEEWRCHRKWQPCWGRRVDCLHLWLWENSRDVQSARALMNGSFLVIAEEKTRGGERDGGDWTRLPAWCWLDEHSQVAAMEIHRICPTRTR